MEMQTTDSLSQEERDKISKIADCEGKKKAKRLKRIKAFSNLLKKR